MRQIQLLFVLGLFSLSAICQEKVIYNPADSSTGYYLAIPPTSGKVRGVLVVFCPYRPAESILPETKLHNVAAANDLLTVYASMGLRLIPDDSVMMVMDRLFAHVADRYKADTSLFAVGGYDLAGLSVLRYAELAQQSPARFSIHPTVVFGIASPVDLTGLYHLYQRQIKKNAFPPGVADARAILGNFNRSLGLLTEHPERYTGVSPFNAASSEPGPERALRKVAVRLYYDTDIEWQLRTRRNGYYDTELPDGAELIDRLLLQGNGRAEFVPSKLPGMRSNGMRHSSAYSIVDETDCIQWIMRSLHIFSPSNPMAFSGPYRFVAPEGWGVERSSFPPPFAPDVKLTGVEEIRFMPGWGVAGSPSYWSLIYLFWLDAGQKVDGRVLQENIRIYYDGLVLNGGGPAKRNIPAGKMIPTTVHIQQIKAEADDVETYSGTVDMLDYMAMKPMRLNFLAHVKGGCTDLRHFPVLLELSPKGFEDEVWGELKGVKKGFGCVE